MTVGEDAPRPEPVRANHIVIWDLCIGLGPIAIEEPRLFLLGQAIVAAVAISLGLLGLLVVLPLQN